MWKQIACCHNWRIFRTYLASSPRYFSIVTGSKLKCHTCHVIYLLSCGWWLHEYISLPVPNMDGFPDAWDLDNLGLKIYSEFRKLCRRLPARTRRCFNTLSLEPGSQIRYPLEISHGFWKKTVMSCVRTLHLGSTFSLLPSVSFS